MQIKVVESERDNLTSQFIRGAERHVDENGLDTLYTRGSGSVEASRHRQNKLSALAGEAAEVTSGNSPYRSPYTSPYKSTVCSYNY